MFPRRVSSAVVASTVAARAYTYQPPGSVAGERRLPWQHRPQSPSIDATVVAERAQGPHLDRSPPLSQVVHTSHPAVAHTEPTVSPAAPRQATASTAPSTAAAAAAASTANRADGGLRRTSPLRMPVLPGPTLDTRLEEIVKTEDTVASEPLPKVVQLLIDPHAVNVESITMADFVAMQAPRQLTALGGNKSWLEWLQNSPYYQQVARLATDSPAHDLRALHQAGLHTLYQWAEQPNLVQVSPRTRSALNAAVQHSVTAFMDEVARVVNTSTQQKPVLDRWLADVVGQFVLSSLNISVEAASAAMWEQRGNGLMPHDVRALREAGALDGAGGTAGSEGGANGTNVMSLLLGDDAPAARTRRKHAASSASGASPASRVLPPGECCTLEHYNRFEHKVIASVRKDAERRNGTSSAYSGTASGGAAGRARGAASAVPLRDAQSEMEIVERANVLIATALTQLLEQATSQLPDELQPLHQGGYLALGRVSELLKSAAAMLNVRDIPVRYFVLHSTLDSQSPHASAKPAPRSANTADPLMVPSESIAPGVFLTGTDHMDVTLKDWTGGAEVRVPVSGGGGGGGDSPSSPATGSTAQPQSSSSSWSQHDDPVVAEYFSVLHRLRRHVGKLSTTSLFEIMQDPERYGGYGFNAAEALGMDQLFGPAKLVEDRLASVLSYPAATVRKPIHALEAGSTSGKTAVLERLSGHRVRPGERAVVVRYKSSATPFVPDLDDHPIAFPSRFWFRVALATSPYFIHTEELFSRAPRSVMWWGNERNWTWSSYQRLILSSSTQMDAGTGVVRGHTEKLAAVLVDDFDVVLDAMESKWVDDASLSPTGVAARLLHARNDHNQRSGQLPNDDGVSEEDRNWMENSPDVEDGGTEAEAQPSSTAETAGTGSLSAGVSFHQDRFTHHPEADLAAAITVEQRHLARARWTAVTGKPFRDVLDSCFAKLTIALGQVNLIVTGHHVSPLLLTHGNGVPVQRHFIPLSSGVGLQQRLRVLPLMSTLYAFHLYHGLELSGVLYEVLKNEPALAGKVLQFFWTGRIHAVSLRLGAAHGWGPRQDGSMPLLRSYALTELFEDLPERNRLFAQPRRARTRLIQLLQRQVCSPNGFLLTGVDTTRRDDRDGIVLPHRSTTSLVSPFALFLVMSRLEELEGLGTAGDGPRAELGGGPQSSGANGGSVAAGAGSREKRIVRAWAEVWTQYAYVVGMMATIPERKREAMRVLLQGVLLLRASAVAGVELELNLKVPAYGFPLLASDTGTRHGRHDHNHTSSSGGSSNGGASAADGHATHPLSAQTVGKAVSVYRSFFASASQSHYSFVPLPGRNGGCDVVMLAGTTINCYDIVTTVEERGAAVLRFAETLLGMLHVLEKHVLPADKVRQLHYVTIVSMDHQSTRPPQAGSIASQDVYRHGAAYATAAPYYMDLGGVFDDRTLDHLHLLQEPLGLAKKTFRTLNDLIDELERAFHVRVHHEFCATTEELASLFTPTLLPLIPDATVLPPYQLPIVTAENLMMKAMFDIGTGSLDNDDDDALILDAEDEGMLRGAEVEDVRSEALLARDRNISPQLQRDVLGADGEALHESAALLEAMMNDGLDLLTGAAERHDRANAATAKELRHDLAIENSLNYHVDGSSTGATAGAPAAATPAANVNGGSDGSGGDTTSQGEDSLAWLHDILTPDTLMSGGLRGSSTSTSGPPAATASNAPGGAGSVPEGGTLFSRFGEPLDAARSTFGLPVQPPAESWLNTGKVNRGTGDDGAHADGDAEADEDDLLDLGDDDDGDGAADTSKDAPASRKQSRQRRTAPAAKKDRKTSGRKAGRGSRGGAGDADGETLSLEDLLMEVGKRRAAASRKTRTGGRTAKTARASRSKTSSTSRGGKKGSAKSASARGKVKAAATAASAGKTRKPPRAATPAAATSAKSKKKSRASRRRSSK